MQSLAQMGEEEEEEMKQMKKKGKTRGNSQDETFISHVSSISFPISSSNADGLSTADEHRIWPTVPHAAVLLLKGRSLNVQTQGAVLSDLASSLVEKKQENN